ncbi:MAG: glycine zipper 2TM domain-containing protein [Burkholderiaceae bacterium]
MLKQLVIVASLIPLAACVTANPDVVSRYDTQRMSSVQDATVLSVRPVVIDGQQSGIGGVSGAVIGGVAGSNVGGPRGSAIVGLVGAIAGGVIGNAVERNATKENALEIILQMKNGDRRMITQGIGQESFAPGEPVIVVTTGGRARVMKAPPVTTGSAAPTGYAPAAGYEQPAAYPTPAPAPVPVAPPAQ